MQINFCKNHTERIAHYRCFHCKSSICTDCRLTIQHHYFCSRKCFLKFKYSGWGDYFRQNKQKFTFSAVAAVLLFLLVELIYFQSKISNLQDSRTNPGASDTVFLPEIKSFLNNYPANFTQFVNKQNKESRQQNYQLSLNLQKNWVANVWNNDLPQVSTVIRKSGAKTFSIPLNYGKNKLRVLVLDQQQNPVYRDEISIDYRKPAVELFRRSVNRAAPIKKMLAFTFDGGSDNAHTEEILAILREYELKCTLFLTGKFMESHPELVREMVGDGHEIGNHTYNHPHLTSYAEDQTQTTLPVVTRDFVRRQLLKTDSIFFEITGKHLKPYWRAPFGEYNREILTWAAENGYLHIRWTHGFDTFDWVTDASSKLYRTPTQILQHFEKSDVENSNGLNGVIVLMHLGSHRNNDHMFEALPELIRTVRDRGYTLASITDLLQK